MNQRVLLDPNESVALHPEEYPMTVREAAKYLGVSPQSVYLWVERKQIPHLRVMGRNIRFLKSDLEGGNRGKGSAQAVHGSPGAAGTPAHPERRGAQEAAAVQSMLGRGVPRRGERVVPAALRLVVGAAADRSSRIELPAQRRAHHHGDRTSDLQGTHADEKGPSGSGEQGRLDSRFQDVERCWGSPVDGPGRRGNSGSDAARRKQPVLVSTRERGWTPDDVQDGVEGDASASEGAVLSHLRSALDVCDALECWGRCRRVGDTAPPAGRCEGLQEVLADEVADETRGAAEAESRRERVRGRFGTGRMIVRGFGTVLRQFSPGKRRRRTSSLPEIGVESRIFNDGM